mmetsp:Transcript_10805/g.29862  ORF Transcript_10805/g.29862 Transcript_10805/m.29862 type:complete len:178 (-) Transcript_10805:181-714(-)
MKFTIATIALLATATQGAETRGAQNDADHRQLGKKGGKKGGGSCGPDDFTGVWQYASQGGGVGWTVTFACSEALGGCQYADFSGKGGALDAPCTICGMIPEENFYVNDDGHCAFDWSDNLEPCYAEVPDACSGDDEVLQVKGVQITSNFWELRFCTALDGGCPVSYNEDTPRLALRN